MDHYSHARLNSADNVRDTAAALSKPQRISGARLLIVCYLLSGASAWGDSEKLAIVELAERARLDIMATPDVGKLQAPQLMRATGEVTRMNWIAVTDQPRSMTAEFAVSPLGWRPFELRFVPVASGEVSIQLMGTWKKRDDETLLRLEVFWDGLQCEGADLFNGNFEREDQGIPVGWHGTGVVLAASQTVPAVEGARYAKTWHSAPLVTKIRVKRAIPVTVRGFSRAALPEDYQEIKRGRTRDTAAHRTAQKFLRGVNFGNDLEVPPGETRVGIGRGLTSH